MKWIKYLTLSCILCLSLSGCDQDLERYNDFIGRWEMSALYLNGGSVNMLPTAELFEPCFKGSTLEFTERLTFELITECDWMADEGEYTFDDTTIEAVGQQGTQHFDFIDGQLKMVIKNGDYTFDLRFVKQQHKSEYVVRVRLEDEDGMRLQAPVGYDTVYYVAHGERLLLDAPELEGYVIIGAPQVLFAEVTEDAVEVFVYRKVAVAEHSVTINLIDDSGNRIEGPEDFQVLYTVKHGESFTIAAPEIEGYLLDSDDRSITLNSVICDTVVTFPYVLDCEDGSPLIGVWSVYKIMNGTTDMTTAAMMLYPCILQCSMEFSIGNAFELVSSCSELPSCTAFYCLNGTLVRIYGTASSEEMRYHANGDLSMDYNFQGTDLTLYFSK